jgi:hypothetical protein
MNYQAWTVGFLMLVGLLPIVVVVVREHIRHFPHERLIRRKKKEARKLLKHVDRKCFEQLGIRIPRFRSPTKVFDAVRRPPNLTKDRFLEGVRLVQKARDLMNQTSCRPEEYWEDDEEKIDEAIGLIKQAMAVLAVSPCHHCYIRSGEIYT